MTTKTLFALLLLIAATVLGAVGAWVPRCTSFAVACIALALAVEALPS